MKPYYQQDGITIYCDDFRNADWLVSDKAVLMTDPPYGINLDPAWQTELDRRRGKAIQKSSEKVVGDDNSLDLSLLFRFPRRLIWGFPYIYDKDSTGWLVWDKTYHIPNGTLHTPVEMASSTLFTGFRVIRHAWAGWVREGGEYRYNHPTQKALRVFLNPLINYTEPDELIIDLFLGTGTCAVAAKQLNHKFIGYEIEEKYCEIAARRCSQSVMRLEV